MLVVSTVLFQTRIVIVGVLYCIINILCPMNSV